jgi:hypothetical protein
MTVTEINPRYNANPLKKSLFFRKLSGVCRLQIIEVKVFLYVDIREILPDAEWAVNDWPEIPWFF